MHVIRSRRVAGGIMNQQGIGVSVPRREDRRFITGRGRYVGDLITPAMARAVFLRSPYAHARVTVTDTREALQQPGVIAVLTGADMKADGIGPIPTQWAIPSAEGEAMFIPPYEGLASDTVRFVGQAYAVVIAETEAQARDAAEHVEVDFEKMEAAATLEAARAQGAPAVWPEKPDNVSLHWTNGDKAATEAAFARAAHVIALDLVNPRIAPMPIEPRLSIGRYDRGQDHLTITTTSQCPHEVQRMLAQSVFGVSETKLDLLSPDVGGGFGMKSYVYPEDVTVLWAARRLEREVAWKSDRSEAFLSDTGARDHRTHAELALDADHRFLALRIATEANMGAYLSQHAAAVPTIYYSYVAPGPYRFGAAFIDIRNVFSHSTPVDAYRGAGRAEAVYVTERLVDHAARVLGVDGAALRAKNLIDAADLPYTTAVGSLLDSGDAAALLDRARTIADAGGFAARREAAREQGLLRGQGIAMYAASCGGCSSADNLSVGALGGSWESARLQIQPSGAATLYVGTHNHGQGHETAFAQLVAERTGLALENVEVVFGDTRRVQRGMGTFGSRSAVICGPAITLACERVVEKARNLAAHMLEVSKADIELRDGAFRVAGTDRSVSFAAVARNAYSAGGFGEEGREPGLDETAFHDPQGFTFPFGSHIAEVEIDPATGATRLVGYTAVDDIGVEINPMIVEGQIHGGVVQGVGQALMEVLCHDETGQLVTGSFMDYTMPRAEALCPITSERIATRAQSNPLGAKGVGEAGTFAAPAAAANAVMDALASAGVTRFDMPATPLRVWQALQRK
jgi:carbon-monoxide dehydrogenase large subunit